MAGSFDIRKTTDKLRSVYRNLKNADGKLLAYFITGGLFLVLALIQIFLLVAGSMEAPRGTMPLVIFDLAVIAFCTALALRRSDEINAARKKARSSHPTQQTQKQQRSPDAIPPQRPRPVQQQRSTAPARGNAPQQFHRRTSATTRRAPSQRRNNDEV